MDEKKAMLEAALFVADEPLSTDAMMDALNLGSPGYVQQVIEELREDLASDDRGLEIIETEQGYQLQVKEPYVEQVKHLAPHQDLGDATLRTLSLIAYNAPVKQSRIVDVRGNRAYAQISELEDRGMVASEKDGRTKVLDVTEDFLEYFGLDSIEEFQQRTEGVPASEVLEEGDEEAGEDAGDGADDDEAADDVERSEDADVAEGSDRGPDAEPAGDADGSPDADGDEATDQEDGRTRITDPTV